MTIAQEPAARAESSLEGLPEALLIEMYAKMWQARRVSQRALALHLGGELSISPPAKVGRDATTLRTGW